MSETPLIDMPLRGFLERLGSVEPTPGGGAAAALAGAMGASLGRMVCELTRGPRFAPVAEQIDQLADQFGRTAAVLRRLVDEDAYAYQGLSAALKLPKDDATRAARLRESATLAASVPLQVAVLSRATIGDIERLRPIANPNLTADVTSAAALSHAAIVAACANVEANLPFVDDALRPKLAAELAGLVAFANEAR
ncbi:MAG: cyclodeaminase/cyclohydrolase family protein [Phycisphaerales bacterium]|nr:cyclodeaminase/cyclohydrolase family protein [Phycisphaerales bacterium]